MKRFVLILGIMIFAACSFALASELEVVEETTQTAQGVTEEPVVTAIEPAVSVAAGEPAAAQASISTSEVKAEAKPETKTEAKPTESAIVKAADDTTPVSKKKTMPMPPAVTTSMGEPTRYTLGPDDVVEINVRRHTEFSGQYPINGEGKIQYKFVGDIEVKGLSKTELKDKLTAILGKFIIGPDIDVSIVDYKSKVIYVIGEVGAPGKYYMKTDKISLREAVVQAGLPTLSAAMRRTQLVRPDAKGKPVTKVVDLYALLYEGKLNLDLEMMPGDVLIVPATMFAKIFRIINPVTSTVSSAKSAATPY
ncbi:MAG TPA: polysaccharide biosynthesis/export family protein [Candidatus Omnitrophota bacterium]|nr:polysaccharide biosynthesis/export family protein [Candidatus Omnitrophota bacterium]